MSESFPWELEKLRRRFGVDAKEFRRAAVEITKKRRGNKPYSRDDAYIAQIRAGGRKQDIVSGRNAGTDEDRIGRKYKKITLQTQYWKTIEELSHLLFELSQIDRRAFERRVDQCVAAGSPPAAPHLILLDIAICFTRLLLEGNRLAVDDRDHVEAGLFHLSRANDIDSPKRRKALRKRTRALEEIIRELASIVT